MTNKPNYSGWLFQNQPIEETNIDLSQYEGFVYLITNKSNSKKYIGRKYLKSRRRPKKGARRKTYDSDWKTYWSSSDILKEDVEKYGEDTFKREIIVFGKTRGDINFLETQLLFKFDVLNSDEYYNENILGKYRKKPTHITEARLYDTEFFTDL